MKSWIGFAVALYPRSWREEFGSEFRAVLDDVRPSWRVFANVLRGAIEMRFTNGTGWMKIVGAMALAGAIVALGMSFRVAPLYVSSATLSVTPQADPVRPTSAEVLHQRAAEHIAAMRTAILSRTELSTIVNDPKLKLYKEELRRKPLEDVIDEMRHNIRIQMRPSADGGLAQIIFDISFSYPDLLKAQGVVREVATKFVEQNQNINRNRDNVYREFWKDISAHDHSSPAPPPPVGETMRVLNAASLPNGPTGSARAAFLAWGISVGAFAGLLAALAVRWPRGAWQLSGFALAGCVLAGIVAFQIPNRFTSTATMQIIAARITEDPLSPIPAATPAVEYIRGLEPKILTFQSLSKIIQDPRLKLYARELSTTPLEEVVWDMVAKDIRIEPMNGTATAFRISFSYYDRFKAQMGVIALMAAVDELQANERRSRLPQMSLKLRQITQRKGDELLDVLDNATLPMAPVSPNRLVILAIGLGIGLLAGAVKLRFGRPGTPASARVSENDSSGASDHLPPSSNLMLVSASNLL